MCPKHLNTTEVRLFNGSQNKYFHKNITIFLNFFNNIHISLNFTNLEERQKALGACVPWEELRAEV